MEGCQRWQRNAKYNPSLPLGKAFYKRMLCAYGIAFNPEQNSY